MTGSTKTPTWAEIDELFEAVLECEPTRRDELLAAAEPRLREAVERLLVADAASEKFLEGDAAAFIGDTMAAATLAWSAEDASDTPERLGPYQVLGLLGRGGMGEVLLAHRADEQFERKVAIKRIRAQLPGVDRHEALARFQLERQTLAQLEHPQIARLYDGGQDEAGDPYLVLEYVEGLPIDRYCDQHALDVPARLRLFVQVCGAVQYAHRHLVVHRDLKPSNILVRADGQPVLLDFGIAKWLARPAEDAYTRTGARPMTPGYASPEQVKGQPITTATDVYSLGVLLYELLTGRRPYRLTRELPHELERAICEEDPEKPSTAVLRSGSSTDNTRRESSPAATIAAQRGTTTRHLSRQLRGDLDTLLSKALRKDPADRYPSVEALADDVVRYLENRPLAARPLQLKDLAFKFVRRHRLGVGLAAAGLALAATLLTVLGLQAAQVRAERDKARLALAFLIDVFRASDPARPSSTPKKGEQLRARDVLDQAAVRIQHELAAQPDVQATLMDAMGQVYQSLGLHRESTEMLQKALGRWRQDPRKHRHQLLITLIHQGISLAGLHRYEEAEAHLAEAESMARAYGEDSLELATAWHYRAALERQRTHHTQALDYSRRSLAIRRQKLQPDHPDLLATLEGMGVSLAFVDEASKSLPVYREILDIKRRSLGPQHPGIAATLLRIASVEAIVGSQEAAGAALEDAVKIRRAAYGRHQLVAVTLTELANWQGSVGQFAAAEKSAQEASDILEEVQANPIEKSLAWNVHGHILSYQMRYREALPYYRRTLEARQQGLPADHNLITNGHLAVGIALAHVGTSPAEAETHLLLGYNRLHAINPRSSRIDLALEALAKVYQQAGNSAARAKILAMTADSKARVPLEAVLVTGSAG